MSRRGRPSGRPDRRARQGAPRHLRETHMSFITKKHLSRRTVLQGLGVTLALPVLESMIPAATVFGQTIAAAKRTRFGAIYFPHGVIQANWNPAAEGAGYEITPILQPIKPF